MAEHIAYAPVVLFTYNRLQEVIHTIEALQKNTLAPESDLYIFSDYAKHKADIPKVAAVRDYLRTVNGFKSINIIERGKNYGLARSIIGGASDILGRYGRIIVLEDDIVTTANFLCYMNQALDFYEYKPTVFSISGHTITLQSLQTWHKDTYALLRPASWGWATWIDRWEGIDWDVSDFNTFIRDKKQTDQFNQGGADLSRMLRHYMQGKNNSWAIRWAYAMFKARKFAIYPKISKVHNIGFSDEATHCNGVNIYNSDIDDSASCTFDFLEDAITDANILEEFRSHYTFSTKLKKKIIEILKKFT